MRQVIDLKAARQRPDIFRAALARHDAADDFDALLAVDATWRELTERVDQLRSQNKPAPVGYLAETVQLRGGFQRDRDGFELSERSGEIFDDLAGDHFGRRLVVEVFQRLVT